MSGQVPKLGLKYWKLRARKLTLHLINVAEINATSINANIGPVLLMFTAVFHKTHYHTYLDWQKQRAPLNRMISTEPGGPGIF